MFVLSVYEDGSLHASDHGWCIHVFRLLFLNRHFWLHQMICCHRSHNISHNEHRANIFNRPLEYPYSTSHLHTSCRSFVVFVFFKPMYNVQKTTSRYSQLTMIPLWDTSSGDCEHLSQNKKTHNIQNNT